MLKRVSISLSVAVSLLGSPVIVHAQSIDEQSIINQQPGEWLSHGRGYDEKRFSPLKQINDSNVKKLGLLWATDLKVKRGFTATPLFHDGVLYTSGPRGLVFALDARDGKIVWQYDPESNRQKDRGNCCNISNRGVALWGNKVFVGTFDGRLIALNAKTGQVEWQNMTVDPNREHSITGAPRVVKGRVIIGYGGADMSGARGYVSAYDADTGKLAWRFYTVPGDPSKPFENKAMEKAAKTWNGQWWKHGGGGTVWDSIAYDPELDLLYIGVGNGFPWNQKIRSPGGGDNLYLSSIVALKPDTGEMVWYYQTTPGETWDYTATQNMILADIDINGKTRKVIMQAPKNGFFYVIDRATGKLISAEKFAKINWAFSVDKKTGRPIEVPGARYDGHVSTVSPSPFGAHNMQPMSFNPQTGLVYIPVINAILAYEDHRKEKYEITLGQFNVGIHTGAFYENPKPPDVILQHILNSDLVAWDPVTQKAVWKIRLKYVWNSGTLTTAGNLVFQGDADGKFTAYNATTGKKLWQFDAKTALSASPVTYEIDGKQYVTIMAGSGGVGSLNAHSLGNINLTLIPRVLTFALNGKKTLPAVKPREPMSKPPASTATAEQIQKGFQLYHNNCGKCHGNRGNAGPEIPDLRQSSTAIWDIYDQIILRGVFLDRGMPRYDDILTEKDVADIKAYLLDEANKFYIQQQGEQ